MKKIISFSLTFFILVQSFFFCFYSLPVYGAPLDVDLDLLEDMASNPEKYEPASMKLTEFLVRSVTGGQALDKFFGTSSQELISNTKALFSKEGNCKTDGNNYYLTQNFTNEFNKAVQDKIHALDGYYLFEPANSDLSASIPAVQSCFIEKYKDEPKFYKFASSQSFGTSLSDYYTKRGYGVVFVPPFNHKDYERYNTPFFMFKDHLGNSTPFYIYIDGSSLSVYNVNKNTSFDLSLYNFYLSSSSNHFEESNLLSFWKVLPFIKAFMASAYGPPFKIFYSLQDVKNYLNKGEQRIYAPKLPSTTISIPIKYINNSVSLPDITYNINTTNKTEVEIQNEYNTTLNNYLNDLNKFSDGGSGNTPTPTPSGGGSGDFGDGTTPTPKPDFGDGSDLTDTNDWLKKIYEWLQSFGDTHSKFEKTITDYIEANDGKLDQIIEAINALSDGKTEDEKNGCKYDFTALSDFMTKLWNESDKKFDKMVELLEENNKYQKKLVNSLNEIKAILVTQTIMDVFQDRSQQTAEKAKDKFPTSLPWDIALVVNAMSAEPEKPQFNLPIQIKSLNINEEIHVDLASGEWEKLAKTCRYLLSILFILLMIQLSRKLFSNGGDD